MHQFMEIVCVIKYFSIIALFLLMNMFSKREFKLEMFVTVSWSYGQWGISIVNNILLVIYHWVILVCILVMLYKFSFLEFFYFQKINLLAAILSSSSCRAPSTEFSDPLSPPVSIVHRSRDVFQTTSFIGTELLYISLYRWNVKMGGNEKLSKFYHYWRFELKHLKF